MTRGEGAGCMEGPGPSSAAVGLPAWLGLLARSEHGGRDYVPRVEGRLPAGLEGSLYRNGPGLFERGGRRKPHLLAADGLVQRPPFRAGKVACHNALGAPR